MNAESLKKNHDNKDSINIEEHLGLVHLCCQRFKNRGVEYDDVFQCGCIGLTKASKKFDFNRGIKFSTYAVPVILGEIKTFFRENGTVKFSRRLKDLSFKIRRESERFVNLYEREPTVHELSELLGEELENILEALDVFKATVSLDGFKDFDDDFKTEIPVEFDDEKIFFKVSVCEVLKTFEKRDKNLIYLRFFKGVTQSQTAKNLGMTQVQVSRREKFLLKTLREKLA